jgi:hypothetical protein
MGNKLRNQKLRLGVRRAMFNDIRSDRRQGYHNPGSMNPHKSASVKQERKKR